MSGFEIFKNRWTISAILELETPLRIGGGQNAGKYSISSAPVLLSFDAKTSSYEPYIPGSSLKGVLRSNIERLVRTFNENKCCVSVSKNKLCGACPSCSIFGSIDAGAKIRVRDSQIRISNNFRTVKEQPHCATIYDISGGKFKIRTKPKYIRGKKIETADTFLRMEEIVISGLSFDVLIDIDNSDETEVGLLILALDEFNKKRAYIGGGSSRGNGFVDIKDISVKQKLIGEDLIISETNIDVDKLKKAGKNYLNSVNSRKDIERRDFDVYYKAHSGITTEGHIVASIRVETLNDFIMQGVEEKTVTSGDGLPIIPGSTIKGYLRHTMIEKGTDADIIKSIFGDSGACKGRLHVSDAYCDDLKEESDKIPEGSVLKMWMVFDNMTREEIDLVSKIIEEGNNIVTGKTTSGYNSKTERAKNNTVRMEFNKKHIDVFRTAKYLEEK